MKKLPFQIVAMIIAWTLPLLAMNANLLESACKKGSFFASGGDNFKKEFDDHNRFSQEKISELMRSMNNGGTVVVLGPGRGSDLPLEELISKFDSIIFIDGYTTPLIKKIAFLPDNLRKKVQVLNQDLTGGFFAILENDRQNLKRAIAQDFLEFRSRATISFAHLHKLIKAKNLHLDLKQYSPSLLISSIVTSQILRLPDIYLTGILHEMLSDKDDSLLQTFAQEMLQTIAPIFQQWLSSLSIAYWQCTLKPYFKAIASSGAKKIYHSLDILDTSLLSGVVIETTSRENEEYAKFDSFMAPTYKLASFENNAWHYKNNLRINWQIWDKKPATCGRCGDNKNVKRCTGCYQIYYCGPSCQRADWSEHKAFCCK